MVWVAGLPVLGLRTHRQKVQSLYKRALRNIESVYPERCEYRYEAVLLRNRFDKNKDIADMRMADKLVTDGEEELFNNLHYQPIKFANSPGGVAYGQVVTPPDWVLDYWHPLEKAAYPEYFKRREQRKNEYVAWWEEQYGKPKPDEHHH